MIIDEAAPRDPAEATPLLGLALEWILVGGVIAVVGPARLSRLGDQGIEEPYSSG